MPFTMTGDKLITPATGRPIDVAEVQTYLMLSTGQDDSLIEMLIDSAVSFVESHLGIAFMPQEWEMTFDRWAGRPTEWWDGVQQGSISELYNGREVEKQLNKYPLISVESVTVDDNPVDVGLFSVDKTRIPGRIVIKNGKVLPPNFKTANGYSVTYTAGFGPAASDIPSTLRIGLISLVAYMYSNRGDCPGASDAWRKSGASGYFDSFKVRRL